jgi:hypothetical protein
MCLPFTHRWHVVDITGHVVTSQCRDCHKTKTRIKNWG